MLYVREDEEAAVNLGKSWVGIIDSYLFDVRINAIAKFSIVLLVAGMCQVQL